MKEKEQNLDKLDNSISNVSNDTLHKKRGMIAFSREFLTYHPTEQFLKVVFSNFFPIAMENDHSFCAYDKIKMFGYSPHFREINDEERTPEYEIFITHDENGDHFNGMVERKL